MSIYTGLSLFTIPKKFLLEEFLKSGDKGTYELMYDLDNEKHLNFEGEYPIDPHCKANLSRSKFFLKKIKERGKLLDIACGTGSFTVWLALQGFRVTGIDCSQVALDRCKELAENSGVTISLFKAHANRLPFKDEEFDQIYCGEFLEHLTDEDLTRSLDEMLRVLKKGGKMIISTPYENEHSDVFHIQSWDMKEFTGKVIGQVKDKVIVENQCFMGEDKTVIFSIWRKK